MNYYFDQSTFDNFLVYSDQLWHGQNVAMINSWASNLLNHENVLFLLIAVLQRHVTGSSLFLTGRLLHEYLIYQSKFLYFNLDAQLLVLQV
jgi:hypothetical protein